MKTTLISIVCFFAFQAVLANDVAPKAVQQKFSEMYPDARLISWGALPEGLVATFRDREGLKKAFYKETGEWLETRVRVGLVQLPEALSAAFLTHYQDGAISSIHKVHAPQYVRYQVEIELPDRILLDVYDSEGRLLEKSTILFSANAASVFYGR